MQNAECGKSPLAFLIRYSSFAIPMPASLAAVTSKLERGERLSFEDGVRLYREADLLELGALANRAREARHGRRATYVRNLHLNYSNLCVLGCDFCAFSRTRGQPGAYERTLDEAWRFAEAASRDGIREIHIVGGCHPDHPFRFYTDLLRGLKARHPGVHLKAFTAVEIDHFCSRTGRPAEAVLAELRAAGLDSLPGGGAEIFAERVRRRLCPRKPDAARWLAIHRAAHRLGIPSTATMLYGHIETVEERVDHLLRLRALQDETGGFTAFVPLAFHPGHTRLAGLPAPTGQDDLRAIAAARLLLDNIGHVKAYWVTLGLKLAPVALHFGADDLDGTVGEERIAHGAGAESPSGLPAEELARLIREAGREPVERDAVYNNAAG
jgi:aminodeoxyfutalosine synthase